MNHFAKHLIMQFKEEIPKVDSKRITKKAEAIFGELLEEGEFNG